MPHHQNCLLGMHDTNYDTPITTSLTNQTHAMDGVRIHCACMANQPSPCASSNAATQKKGEILGKKQVVTAGGLINRDRHGWLKGPINPDGGST